MINSEINNVLNNYLIDQSRFDQDPTRPRSKNNYTSVRSLSRHIPEEINKFIDTGEYYCKGSAGEGNFNEVPWVGIFDREITVSARKGYYIVFLFNAEMKGVYLRLALGWTQYVEFYNGRNRQKKARQHIKEHSNKAKRLLRSTQGFLTGDIDLSATNNLGKGYENGGVIHKYYPSNDLPSDNEIHVDLQYMIGVYRELKGMLGSDVFTFDTEASFSVTKTTTASQEDQSIDNTIEEETSAQAKERRKASITGDKAEKFFEDNSINEFGWVVVNKTDSQNLGYDFKCNDPELFIEIKGCLDNLGSIRLTNREWELAREQREKYILVIVYQIDDEPKMKKFVDPYNTFNDVIKEQTVLVKSLHIKGSDIRSIED